MPNFESTWDKSLNVAHISNDYEHYEAARNSFFVFVVDPSELTNLKHPDFDASGMAEGQTIEELDLNDRFDGQQASDYIRLNVLKASVPNFTVEVKEYRRGNDVVKFAGVPTFAEGSITVDDVVGLHVKDMLYAWLYLAYDPITRMGGRMKDYKKTCTLVEYTQDYKQIRKWTLEGCFITGITEGEFDRESDDKRQLQVAIAYDRAIMEPEYDAK